MKVILASIGLVLLTVPAYASGPGEGGEEGTHYMSEPMTYELFEASVPHSDLETCPAEFDPDAVFCRMTLTEGGASIWVFSLEDEQPLLALKRYELNEELLPF